MTRLVVVWVHVVAAAAWVGGLLHASHLVVPGLARGERSYLALLTRGRLVSWLALALLLASGLGNLSWVGIQSPWLMLKILLALALLALAAHRDFALVPGACRAIEGGTEPAAALRGLRAFDHGLLLLALGILFLAVGVARGR